MIEKKTKVVGIFDFDRVLFDTDAFKARLNAEGLGDMDRGEELLDAIEEKGIDWDEFVNKEALEFLKSTDDTCYIVSSFFSRNRGDNDTDREQLELFQLEKIRRSGLFDAVNGRVVTTDREKTQEFKNIKEGHPDALLYVVDDEKENDESARELRLRTFYFPTIKNFVEPSREGMPLQSQEVMSESFSKFLQEREAWLSDPEEDLK